MGGMDMRLHSEFLDFMRSTSEYEQEGVFKAHSSILMWNIVGLPTPDMLYPRTGCVDTNSLETPVNRLMNCFRLEEKRFQTLQEIFRILRYAQRDFHCAVGSRNAAVIKNCLDNRTGFVFERPLAFTIELAPDLDLHALTNEAYLIQFIFWMERVLGCSMTRPGQVFVPQDPAQVKVFCDFNGYGFFDSWIIRAFPKMSEREQLMD